MKTRRNRGCIVHLASLNKRFTGPVRATIRKSVSPLGASTFRARDASTKLYSYFCSSLTPACFLLMSLWNFPKKLSASESACPLHGEWWCHLYKIPPCASWVLNSAGAFTWIVKKKMVLHSLVLFLPSITPTVYWSCKTYFKMPYLSQKYL